MATYTNISTQAISELHRALPVSGVEVAGVLDAAAGLVSGTTDTIKIDGGGTYAATITVAALAAARTYTVPDAGAAAEFVMSAGTQTITGAKTFPSTTVINDATGVEIKRVADRSNRSVGLGSQLAVSEDSHDGRTLIVNTSAASTITLPAPTVGFRLRILVLVAPTSGCVISCAASTFFAGSVNLLDADAAAQAAYAANGTTINTITLNGTTKGGQIGDWLELEGISSTKWAVKGQLVCPAGSNPVSPFSAV